MNEPTPSRETAGLDANVKAGLPLAAAPAPPPPTDGPAAYQPISGWAIAGLTTGVAFTKLVVIGGIVAFYQGAPFFFPVWIMGFAVLGIALSLYGQRHVQSSEGTRTGAGLARWGFRLNLISGLLYFSYYFVTGFAVQSQANTFVMEMKDDDSGFFPRLREGETNRTQHNTAFLLTQSPNSRSARPENERAMRAAYDKPTKEGSAGLLTMFREKEILARILAKGIGKDVEITPGSVLDWRYEKRSYRIYRSYHIRTPELEMDYVLAVFSVEAEAAGQGRRWFINLTESGSPRNTPPKLTPLGEGLVRVRQSGYDWLDRRFKAMGDGEGIADADKIDQTPWQDGLLYVEDGKPLDRKAQIAALLAGKSELKYEKGPFGGVATPPDLAGRWEQAKDGRVRLFPLFRFTLQKPALKISDQPKIHQFEILATLETNHAVDLAKLGQDARFDWSLISIEVTAIFTVPDRGASAPPM